MRRSAAAILSGLMASAAVASTAFAQGSPAASSFAQLTGERGCILQTGLSFDDEETDVPSGCGRESGLIRAHGVAMSPDDKQVYVVSGGTPFGGSSAVVTFQRSAEDGALSFASCVSDSGGDGRAGSDGLCRNGDALMGPGDIAFSPDGKFAYVASASSNGVAWLARDPATGALTPVGCVKSLPRDDRCSAAFGLSGADDVAVSPDGDQVYVTARVDGAIVVFSRDAATGALTERMCVSDSGSDGRCLDGTGLAGASSVTVAPDGRDVYVTANTVGAVTGYGRDTTTGALTPRGCLVDQAPSGGPCTSAPGLAGAWDAAISPDGRNLYVVSQGDSALAIFDRDTASGNLTAAGCLTHQDPQGADAISDEGDTGEGGADGCQPAKALAFASAVAVSRDGRAVFASSPEDYLAAFQRDPATGRLAQFGCAEEELTYHSCTEGRGLFGANALAASADARNVYVTTKIGETGGVVVFGASVAIATRAAIASHGGIRVRLACPAIGRACRGRVVAARASAARAYRIASGRARTVRLRLSHATRSRLRHHRVLHITLVARDAASGTVAARRWIGLRAAGKPAARRRG